MPGALNLKPEQIDSAENRSQFCVAVLGCGQKGILFAVTFAKAGFSVTCSDANASVIKKVAKGKIPFSDQETQIQLKRLITSGQLIVTSELKKTLSKSEIIIITVPAKVDEKKKADYSETVNALKLVGFSTSSGFSGYNWRDRGFWIYRRSGKRNIGKHIWSKSRYRFRFSLYAVV